ncbi:hypothetical protein BRADI_5g18097v3 [Brachypodium distachyon]|uniref:Uncharacterized protein n=1 Tax=Brachypodium distachyon TaxID=15368 RepID=A0A2K2CHY3_BRADI|nr:hypothetical protein BRADI_5g18097v3 [Brachypodium distachyon]
MDFFPRTFQCYKYCHRMLQLSSPKHQALFQRVHSLQTAGKHFLCQDPPLLPGHLV